MQLLLPIEDNDDSDDFALAGFRLQRFEVLNWGTFDQRPEEMNLAGKMALLTGENSEPLIRLRFLYKALQTQYSFPVSDFSTPISEFKQLSFKQHYLIITENLMPFLRLPHLPNSLAIFGSGYGIERLKSVDWLNYCTILYWGDLDVDGFKILSQLRYYFPHTISIMMDQETFSNFEEFPVNVSSSNSKNLRYLTEEEYLLFSYLFDNEKRLEQERISQDYVNRDLFNVLQHKRLLQKMDLL